MSLTESPERAGLQIKEANKSKSPVDNFSKI